MDYIQPLDVIPTWGFFLLLMIFTFIAIELGYRIGGAETKRNPKAREKDLGTITGAVLGLMSFFLVFQISLAGDRFLNRRRLVTDEANAIRTTYLRAGYLQEPLRTNVRLLLAEYAQDR